MDEKSDHALDTLAAAGVRAAGEHGLDEALRAVVDAASEVTGADAVAIRVVDAHGRLPVRASACRSEALEAELAGSSFALQELPGQMASAAELPGAVQRAARRARAADALLIPVWADGVALGSLELLRAGRKLDESETAAARVAAAQLGLVLRAFGAGNGERGSRVGDGLELAGDALGAALEETRGPDEVVWIAARASGAEAARLWHVAEGGELEPLASTGGLEALDADPPAWPVENEPVRVEAVRGRTVATLTLGQPPLGILQLVFAPASSPSQRDLDRLGTFAVRAAQALRAGERARTTSLELERSEALLAVLGQAIAELSLAHTLETAVARVSELLRADRVAIYLGDASRLRPEDGAGAGRGARRRRAPARARIRPAQGAGRPPRRGCPGRHSARSGAHRCGGSADRRGSRRPARRARGARGPARGLPAARAGGGAERRGAPVGAGRPAGGGGAERGAPRADERQAAELQQTIASERKSGKRLRALYEISRSFAQSLSLDATLDSVTTAAVELLDADAAVIRVLDGRGDMLVPRAPYVADARLEALRPLLEREQAVEELPNEPLMLDPPTARRLGEAYELLVPFLEHGATALVVPIATSAELLATLTVVSLDPSRRLGDEQVENALSSSPARPRCRSRTHA